MIQRVVRFNSLFVGQIPFKAKPIDIISIFPYEIETIEMPERPETGENKGYCFVKFKDDCCVKKVINEHPDVKYAIGARVLNLNFKTKRPFSSLSSRARVSDKTSLFLGNLPFDATECDLIKYFPKAMRIMLSKQEDGKSKGNAFVEFSSHEEMLEAYKDNLFLEIGKRKLTLAFADRR